MKSSSTTPSIFNTYPRTCLLVLATSKGSRLFPMVSDETPKHLLPIAGVPSIQRLLETLAPQVSQIIVAVSPDDSQTLPLIETLATLREPWDPLSDEKAPKVSHYRMNEPSKPLCFVQTNTTFGPIDVIRQIEQTKILHPQTRLCVVPGDLVILPHDIRSWDPILRPPSTTSDCISLLVDVGEVDEHGVPLKESAKAKKGSLSRDDEDIEYIGLSYPVPTKIPTLPRIVLKQPVIDAEAEDLTGSTPKLAIPKARLRMGRLVVQKSWNDVHVYSLPPWTRHLIASRTNLSSFQEDLLPLLISRQFRGTKATFSSGTTTTEKDPADDNDNENTPEWQKHVDDEPYNVTALVLPNKTVLRSNTFAAYQYACRETVAAGAKPLPPNAKWNGKFQTLVLEGSSLGAKINMKSSIVGKNCELGDRCRLNNVILMDGVVLGDNCSLQNTILGPGARLGNNCSLNDCQVGPNKQLPAGTKEKGESFMVGDAGTEDLL
eukprot:Nitzschia sp. Nitz4//scaffold65_size103378//90226//91829//NITZ4_004482-RA/size103378-augustus-gene-0.89-mRNA-1//-1//CDS//3329556288//8055//frame0